MLEQTGDVGETIEPAFPSRPNRLDHTNPRLADAASRTCRQLEETLAKLPAPSSANRLSLDDRATLAWSMVHGFATLYLENTEFAESQGTAAKAAVATLKKMLYAARPVFSGRSSKGDG